MNTGKSRCGGIKQTRYICTGLLAAVLLTAGACREKKETGTGTRSVDRIRYEVQQIGEGPGGDSDAYRFNIRISVDGYNHSPLRYMAEHYNEYNDRVQYMTFDARRDFYIECDGEKTEPHSYLFENNYNMTSFETVVLSFLKTDRLTKCKDCFLVFNDRLFNNGFIKFNTTLK